MRMKVYAADMGAVLLVQPNLFAFLSTVKAVQILDGVLAFVMKCFQDFSGPLILCLGTQVSQHGTYLSHSKYHCGCVTVLRVQGAWGKLLAPSMLMKLKLQKF